MHLGLRPPAPLSQITDCYVFGIVGIAPSYAVKPLGFTSFWMGMIGAGSMFGIFFGCLIGCILADRLGRKPLYSLPIILMLLLSVSQFFLNDPAAIALVRFLLGMVVGTDYTAGIALLLGARREEGQVPRLVARLLDDRLLHRLYYRFLHGRPRR